MTWRDHLAKEAPIPFEMVERAWKFPINLNEDKTREAAFAVWAMMRYEWADAMLKEGDKVQP